MNKTFRTIWNHTRGCFVVAHEKTATRGKSSSTRTTVAQAVTAALITLGSGQAAAVSSCVAGSGAITIGSAEIDQCVLVSGDSLTVSGSGSISVPSADAVLVDTVNIGGITINGTVSATAGNGLNISTATVTDIITISGTLIANEAAINVLDHSTISGGISNSGTISSHGYGVLITGSDVANGIINSGFISADTAINITASTFTGDIINSGNISVGSYGIKIVDSTFTGDIINSGTISAGSTGININRSSITGNIINSGTISAGGTAGIGVSRSSITGDIINSGTISSANGDGIYISWNSSVGGVTNGGIIDAVGDGIYVSSSTVTGGISNSGSISSSGNKGIFVRNSSVSGDILNSGSIDAHTSGIVINGSTITGRIINSGRISATNESTGINISGSTITAGIINSGSIEAYSTGIRITNGSTVNGGIINSGSIIAGDDGIVITGSSTVTDGIINSGTIAGYTGINVDSTSSLDGITNSGLIQGYYGIRIIDTSSVTGGIYNEGTISGTYRSVSVDGSSSLSGITIAGNNTAKFIGEVFAENTPVTVATGATYTMDDGQLFTLTNSSFTNAGTLNIGAGNTGTITGNFVQNADAIYRMGLTGNSYGVLNVVGDATVAGGIDVVTSGAPTLTNGTATLSGIIQATGTMNVTPTDITVTDNNLFYNFTAATVSGAGNLDLVVAADPNGLTNAVAPNNPSAIGVAQALQSIYNGGAPAGFQPVFDALATMTPQALNAALIELTPSLQGAGTQAAINALHSMNRIIQSRMESLQGLNSGDNTADQYAWTRVFGNWGDQDDHRGVAGFESQTQGLALGLDKPINDHIRAGALLTYASTDLKSNFGSSKVDVDTYAIAGYGSYNIDPQTDINVQLDVGLNKADSTRRLGFLGTTAKGDFDSFNWHVSGGIGHLFHLTDKTDITPSMRVDYTHVKTDGYTEKGAGVLNLRVDGSNYEELLLTVDTKLSHKLTDDGLKFVANGSVGYDFINEQAQTTSSFTGGGPSFVTEGLDVSPWIYRGGLGLVKETGNGMEFSARYDAEGRTSGYLNQTASVKVRWAF